jgi:hypothetical protein
MDNPEIDEHGNKWWHDSDGNHHRDDGPAVDREKGNKFWYQHGIRHRTDGPAVEWPNGDKWWYLNNQRLSFVEWLDQVDISDEDKVMMKLKYS